jgi:hypothetical protein
MKFTHTLAITIALVASAASAASAAPITGSKDAFVATIPNAEFVKRGYRGRIHNDLLKRSRGYENDLLKREEEHGTFGPGSNKWGMKRGEEQPSIHEVQPDDQDKPARQVPKEVEARAASGPSGGNWGW